MDAILRGYAVNEPTWFYLSFLLVCAVFVRFQRLWSLRNLDLLALLLVSPGLLVVRHYPAAGYSWLFVTTGWLLVRMLCDPGMVRRPRLEPNMNAAGLAFLCGAAFLFLSTKVFTELPPASTVESVRRADELLTGQPQSLPPAPTLVESPPVPSRPWWPPPSCWHPRDWRGVILMGKLRRRTRMARRRRSRRGLPAPWRCCRIWRC